MNTRATFRSLMPLILVAVLVAMGVAAGMMIAPARAQSTYASIGYVDVQESLAAHPDLETVLAQIQQYEESRLEELSQYQSRSDLTDEERRQLMEDLYRIQAEVDAERQRLTEPLIQDVIDATSAVGEESGIEVIIEAGSVMWGGLNLTPLVIQRLHGS